MSHKRLHNRCVKRNEPVRVAEAEIKGEELAPLIPTTITDVVEAIENGTIPEGVMLKKLRAVDCSGNMYQWYESHPALYKVKQRRIFDHIFKEHEEFFYRFPQDKIIGIFKSDRLPGWWKCRKLAGNNDFDSNRHVCSSFIPTFADFEPWAEGLDDLEYAFLRAVLGYASVQELRSWTYQCSLWGILDLDEIPRDIVEMVSRHPDLARSTHDCFGNNALHYCWTRWIETDGLEFIHGEFAGSERRLAKFLIEHGCDPNEPNDFGVRYCDLRID